MDVIPSTRNIAERQFVVEATQSRVWDLLATVTYQQLPLEQVDILSLDSFRAVLRWGVRSVRFPFYVEGKLTDISRPISYGCVILVKKGPVQLGVRVSMVLKAIEGGQTKVYCTATEEGKRTVTGLLMRRLQRNFAQKMFDSIGARLQRLCS